TLDTRRLEGQRLSRAAQAVCFPEFLRPEDRGDHSKSRTIANAGCDEEDEEHGEKAGKALYFGVVHNADGSGGHDHENPEGDSRAARLIGEEPAERACNGPDQRPKESNTQSNLRKLRLEQQRKRSRIADKRAEGPDIEPRHNPRVLALHDEQLILERRSRT